MNCSTARQSFVSSIKKSFRDADVGFGLSGCSLSVPHVPSEASSAPIPPSSGVGLPPVGAAPPQAGPARHLVGEHTEVGKGGDALSEIRLHPRPLGALADPGEQHIRGEAAGDGGARPSPAPRSARPSASLHRCMAARPVCTGMAVGSGLSPGGPRHDGFKQSGPGPSRSPRTSCQPGWRRTRRACRRRSP